MRGRRPSGAEYLDKRTGSEEAKERAKAILGTMFAGSRVLAACDQLGIHETRFHQLRERAVDAIAGRNDRSRTATLYVARRGLRAQIAPRRLG